MDRLTILVGLIGVFIVCPNCINGKRPAMAPSTGCKNLGTGSRLPKDCLRFCGDDIITIYTLVCEPDAIKRSSTELTYNDIGLKKEEASQFLSHRPWLRTKRSPPRAAQGNVAEQQSTTLVTECCRETCVLEEVREYC